MIEFSPGGEIFTANPIFLATMGYGFDEIKGRHHRMFVDPAYAASPEYETFWNKLRAGEFIAGKFSRLAKGGQPVQLSAAYNPILNFNGRVIKIVKCANDVSDLTEIGEALSRLAHKNLTQPIEKPFQPLLAPTRQDFNDALSSLRTALLGVSDSAETVTAGVREIVVAWSDIARGAEQQAASLEETSAALSAVTETVKKTAAGSKQASAMAGQARAQAGNGGNVVKRAVEAVAESKNRLSRSARLSA